MKSRANSRTKYSLLNAMSAMCLTLVNGLFGIVVTRLVIGRFGSDFNGLNSTANQIINVLLILEGGFTLASNVALFAPISRGDYATSNGVLSATKKKFQKIALIFLAVGIIVAAAYSFAAKTSLSREFVFTVVLMAVIPQALNLFYTTTYRVLLQTQQREFVISGFTALTIGLGHIVNIILITHGGKMWMVRFVTMMFAIGNCFLITGYTKRKNPFIDFSVAPLAEQIKGTGDVMAQKVTGVIYSSWPIVFLSISAAGGTMLASVYAVYNNVFVMLKALLHGVIDAPRLGFGQMLTERKKDEVWPAFRQYELIAFLFTFIAMTTACALILPFIAMYTSSVDDINYYDKTIAMLMVAIGTVEMLHIPSGHIINMSGNFRTSRNFQIVACVFLIVAMMLLGASYGVYGMLISLLGVAVLLACLEIGFVHSRFFRNRIKSFVFMAAPFMVIGVIAAVMEMKFFAGVNSVIRFLIAGVILVIINSGLAAVLGYVFDREDFTGLVRRGLTLIKRA